MKRLRITIEGKSYDVDVELLGEETGSNAAPAPAVRAPVSASAPLTTVPLVPPAAATASNAAPGDVTSPLAGTVVSVDTQVGSQVAAGDKLITLEAMKMNTIVSAPKAGKVVAIHVSAGSPVEEGKPLLTIS